MGYFLADVADDPPPGNGRFSAWLKALRGAPALITLVLVTRLWAVLAAPLTFGETQLLAATQRLAAWPAVPLPLNSASDLLHLLAWPTWLHALLLRLPGLAPDSTAALLSGRLLAAAAVTAAVAVALRLGNGWLAVLLALHTLTIIPLVLLPQLALPLLCLVVVTLRLPHGLHDRPLWWALLLIAVSQPIWLLPLLLPITGLLPVATRRQRVVRLLAVGLLLGVVLVARRALLPLPLSADLPAWLFSGIAADRQPASYLLPSTDLLITLTALLAALFLRREHHVQQLLLWLVTGLLLLVLLPIAPTAPGDLPAAALLAPALLPPLLALAAHGLQTIWARFQAWNEYWRWLDAMLPRPPWYAWLTLAALISFIAVIYGSTAVEQALGRIGWLQLPAGSALPAAPYYGLALGANQQLLLATDSGRYRAAPDAVTQGGLLRTTTAVRFVAGSAAADWWAGPTELTLQRAGQPPQPVALPAALGRIRALAARPDGSLLLAASSGAWRAGPDGALQPLSAVPPLPLHSVAVGADGTAWFGAIGVVFRLAADGTVTELPLRGARRAAVTALLPHRDGTLYIAAAGAGLGHYDGRDLQWRQSVAGRPLRLISALTATPDGAVWIAAARSTEPGGSLLRIAGSEERVYTARNSGFPDAEAVGFAVDRDGRLWMATRYDGLLLLVE